MPTTEQRFEGPVMVQDGADVDTLGGRILAGDGTPETNVIGWIGDIFLRRDGGASTTLYVKESGAGTDTGWIAK